jgi:hypothetical protein
MAKFEGELAWVEASLRDTGKSVRDFPGDDLVAVPYATALTYDPEGHHTPHISTRGTLTRALAFGAEIDEVTVERVKRMAFAVEAVDEFLGKPGLQFDERKAVHEVGMTLIRERLATAPYHPSDTVQAFAAEDPVLFGLTEYWANSVRTMQEPYRSKVKEHSLGCLALSLEKMTASNSRQYAELVFRESQECGRLWAATAWSNQADGNEARFEQYDDWLGKFVGRIALFGAALDMRKDYAQGRLGFRPRTPRDEIVLMRESFVDPEVFKLRQLSHYALKFLAWSK